MIKVLAAFSRKPGWSVDEFLCHYQERHAPLVAGTASFTAFCHRYVQNYPEHRSGWNPPTLRGSCDAISEMWFETVEAMSATYAAADYLERARPDEHRFADVESASVLVLQERELSRNDAACIPDKRWTQLPLTKLFVFYSSRNPSGADETVGIDEFKFHSMSDALAFAEVWTAGATKDDRLGYPAGAEISRLFLGHSHAVFSHD